MAFPVSVPDARGVPPVAFSGGDFSVTIASGDAYSANLFSKQWGLFRNGRSIITADSVIDFTYRQDWSICDYPLEKGAFESYNKVQIPFDVRLRFVAGGSIAKREALLSSVVAIAGTLDLYDAVTPEAVYPNVNVRHYDYHRSAQNGVGLMLVDLWLVEVRNKVQSVASSVISPSAASPVNGGTVQGVPATAAQDGAVWT